MEQVFLNDHAVTVFGCLIKPSMYEIAEIVKEKKEADQSQIVHDHFI